MRHDSEALAQRDLAVLPEQAGSADRPTFNGEQGKTESVYASLAQFCWLWNHQQGLKTPSLHLRILNWFEEAEQLGLKRLLLLVFRGAGKSTIAALYCSWLIYKDPNIRILILSAEARLAGKFSENVKNILENHPLTRKLCKDRRGTWSSKEFIVARDRIQRDPTVVSRGLLSNTVGARSDIIVCDDIEVINNSNTSSKREKVRNRLDELNFILAPHGKIIYLGTPHTIESIYSPKSEISEQSSPYLVNYERLVIPIVDNRGNCAWPERFDQDVIENIRKEIGPLQFQSQMMLQPTNPRKIRLEPHRLKTYNSPPFKLDEKSGNRVFKGVVRCFWDPAFGHADKGDRSAIALIYACPLGHVWIHDVQQIQFNRELLERQDEASQLCLNVQDFSKTHDISTVYVETNGIGQFLPSILRGVARRSNHRLNIVPHYSSTSKDQRILAAFDPLIAAGRLHINEKLIGGFFWKEMMDWHPKSNGFDDGLDAVSAAIALLPLGYLNARAGQTIRSPFSADHNFSV